MQYKTFFTALVLGLLTGEAAARGGFGQGQNGGNRGGNQGGNQGGNANSGATNKAGNGNNGGNNGGNSNALQLNPNAVQTGSQQNGLQASGVEAGEAASATDPANFINFCAGKTLTNGLQVKTGSCNGIVMGNIPSQDKMVSTIITFPSPGQDLEENQTFNLSANIINLQAGAFTNAQATYYAAPQDLNSQGEVIGHLHFTVQAMTSLSPTAALDPKTFAFFKGVNDAGDGKGNLQAVVTGGLPAGIYRVCTMSSAANHQSVLMPVAQ
jgi:transcription initiation factor TFIID subunit 15